MEENVSIKLVATTVLVPVDTEEESARKVCVEPGEEIP